MASVWFTRSNSTQECVFVEGLSPKDANKVADELATEFGEELKIQVWVEE